MRSSEAARREAPSESTGLRGVYAAWWPLAASWLLMSVEMTAVSAVIARLPEAKTHLAAYGSVVFPLALIVEAPVIMLLAASTALSQDARSFRALRRFTQKLGFVLTVLHLLVAFTPLFDAIVLNLMDVPPEVIEPARLGFQIMTPWTWLIAYRRFHQGALIRFGHAGAVTIGTTLRLTAMASTLGIGFSLGNVPGVVVASLAIVAGVTAEAVYTGWRVRPVVAEHLSTNDDSVSVLRGREFLGFYVPLALTSVITLVAQPVVASAMARMPAELESLAVWPVVIGGLFMLQAFGIALNEVVVSQVEEPARRPALLRFALILSFGTGAVVALLAATPLSSLWLRDLSGLTPQLVEMGRECLWWAVPIPMTRGIQSWYQGVLVATRHTRPISEAVVVFLAVCGAVLAWGVMTHRASGLVTGVASFSLGRIAQTLWLWWRSRAAFDALSA